MPSSGKDSNESYVIILKKQSFENPPHLKPYQEKMRRVAPICKKEAEHLKSSKRIVRYNQCIAEMLKK